MEVDSNFRNAGMILCFSDQFQKFQHKLGEITNHEDVYKYKTKSKRKEDQGIHCSFLIADDICRIIKHLKTTSPKVELDWG
jgi:hypothetical protein